MPDVDRRQQLEDAAPAFERAVRHAREHSDNERHFQTHMWKIIDDLATQIGHPLDWREEQRVGKGRADAVYNFFVIEYEKPGSMGLNATHHHTVHAVGQVKGYIRDLVAEHKATAARILGVAFDGHVMVFVRYRGREYAIDTPRPLNEATALEFLLGLFTYSTHRALIPENLVDDFGEKSDIAKATIACLYNKLGAPTELTQRLYDQWTMLFSEAAGEDASSGRIKHAKMLGNYADAIGTPVAEMDISRFLFALQTYFSFLVKQVARLCLLSMQAGWGPRARRLTDIATEVGEELHQSLYDIERGGFFRSMGIANLLEGDFFHWYLTEFDDEIEGNIRSILSRLVRYDPSTLNADPWLTRDLLKHLYHELLPRPVRHDLGEYYTPDWLAERVITQTGEPLFQLAGGAGATEKYDNVRVLDPACGSGTFLVLSLRAAKRNLLATGTPRSEVLARLLDSIVGIDLNPLAVLSARVNYLIAILDLLGDSTLRTEPIELPVYLADSILIPERGRDFHTSNRIDLETRAVPEGVFSLPTSVDTRMEMEKLANLLDEDIPNDVCLEVFLERAATVIEPTPGPGEMAILTKLYEQLQDLHSRGLNGIWARVIKNAFMPRFLAQFDYVVGNPPWINWESLPQHYRQRSKELWHRYGLFVHKGMDTILGKGKKDLSTLLTVVALDRYLKPGGKLCFVITQSVWKTSGAGQGFRRFVLPDGGCWSVQHVDDMSSLRVFEGASTKTSVFVARKGDPHRYPTPYTVWKKTVFGKSLGFESTLQDVEEITKRVPYFACPVDEDDPTSIWLTGRKKAITALQRVLGGNEYSVNTGVFNMGATGVYWLKIHTRGDAGMVGAENLVELAKKGNRPRKEQHIVLEDDLLYPLIRPATTRRWRGTPEEHILFAHDVERRKGIEERTIQQHYPHTWKYLKRFEDFLRSTSGFRRFYSKKAKDGTLVDKAPFYSLFGTGTYTLAPWKVVWPNMGDRLDAAVVGPIDGKCVIPQHTLTMVGTQTASEAHYLAALMNSVPIQFAAHSIMQSGGKNFGGKYFVDQLHIPPFSDQDALHQELAELSKQAHAVAGGEDKDALHTVERRVDSAAARVWRIAEDELDDMRIAYDELMWKPKRKPKTGADHTH
jgi:hypothetical protein